MSQIDLEPMDRAVITRYYAEHRTLSFAFELIKELIEVTESEASTAKSQVEYLESKLGVMVGQRDRLADLIKDTQNHLNSTMSDAIRRLGGTEEPGVYRAEVSDSGDVISLTKQE